jgi:hypothetical protein
MLGTQFSKILVIRRSGKAFDLGNGLGEVDPGYEPEHRSPNVFIGCRFVQQDGASLLKFQGSSIEIAKGSEPLFLSYDLGLREHARNNYIK